MHPGVIHLLAMLVTSHLEKCSHCDLVIITNYDVNVLPHTHICLRHPNGKVLMTFDPGRRISLKQPFRLVPIINRVSQSRDPTTPDQREAWLFEALGRFMLCFKYQTY